MIFETKFNIGDEVYFLSQDGNIESGIINKITADFYRRFDQLIFYVISYSKNNTNDSIAKLENEIYSSLEELKENIKPETITIYKYK